MSPHIFAPRCAFSAVGSGSAYSAAAPTKAQKVFFDVIGYVILIIGGITMLYPFWWMFAASLAGPTLDGSTVTSNALQNMITTIFWPSSTNTQFGLFYNYQQAITLLNSAWQTVTIGGQAYAFWRSVINTLLYSLIPVTIGVFTSASAAFAFAKLDFKGKISCSSIASRRSWSRSRPS